MDPQSLDQCTAFGTTPPAVPGIPLKLFVPWFWKHTPAAETADKRMHAHAHAQLQASKIPPQSLNPNPGNRQNLQ